MLNENCTNKAPYQIFVNIRPIRRLG